MNIGSFSKTFDVHHRHLLDAIKTGCSFASLMSLNVNVCKEWLLCKEEHHRIVRFVSQTACSAAPSLGDGCCAVLNVPLIP